MPNFATLLAGADIRLLFAARAARMFAYGFLSVALALYLEQRGLTPPQIGWLFSLILLGDAGISLWMTLYADHWGRRRMLLLGAVLMILAGLVFSFSDSLVLLLIAGILGVISPSGNEIGPFLSIEQAALAQLVADRQRTALFAWHNLTGSVATAAGALASGGLAQVMLNHGAAELAAYQAVLLVYTALGVVLLAVFRLLSARVEVQAGIARARSRFGLHQSRPQVLRLSALFALDAFGGGFVIQSFMAYWLHIRFGLEPALLGTILFAANLLAAASALLAARIAARIGLINTMVFTHLPSNLLLMLVPLMPTLETAVGVLLLRFSLSQMDVPTRQSYTMALVSPDERSAAAGVTGIARSLGAAASPALTGLLLASPALLAAPFLIAGGLKVGYDLLLYSRFRHLRPPEESG